MLFYFIGDIQFHGMSGSPEYLEEELHVESRPGVDGAAVYALGQRGTPFELSTIVGCTNYAEALAVCELYKTMKAVNPVQLMIANVVIDGIYKVLSVRSEPKAAVLFRAGGESFFAFVRAQWTLMAMVP